MKKKVLKTTVAASLVFGSIAGIPLSNKGIQELFGTPVASASITSENPLPVEANELLQRMIRVYNQLTPEEQAEVKQLSIDLSGSVVPENEYLVEPIINFVNAKQEGENEINAQDTLPIIAAFSIALSSDQETLSKGLNGLRESEHVRTWVSKILAGSGVSLDGENQLQVSDFVAFLNASQSAVANQFTLTKALTYLNAHKDGTLLTTQRAALKADLKAAYETVIGNTSLKLSQALTYYTSLPGEKTALAEALADTALNYLDKFDSDTKATTAILKGIVRSEAKLASTSGGVELTPRLTIFDKDISDLVTWGVETPNSFISFTGGKFVLSSSAPADTNVTASVYAKDKLFDELVFKGDITLRRASESGPVGGGPAPSTGLPPQAAEQAQAAKKAVEEAKAKLAEASPQEKSKIMKEALKNVKEAIKEIGKVSLSNAVTVTNGKATANVNVGQLQQQLAAIKSEVEALKASLKELDANANVNMALTLDLGDVDADEVSLQLVGALLTAVTGAGATSINVTVNGAGINFAPSEVAAGTTLTISNASDDSVSEIADVVTFTFVSPAGGEIDEFDRPVSLTLSVDPEADFDEELLTAAKVTEDGLEIVGGTYEDGTVTAPRSTLSTYTVIENDVEFADTASVGAWAGKEIKVVAAKGIVEGRGAGDFDPNANVTRAEFAKMISKALGIAGGSAKESFSDVSADDWFQPYVAAVSKWGITNGRTPSSFDPNAPITRAEMATMIARGLQQVRGEQSFIANEDVLAQFKDADQILATLEDGVAFAADLGIVQGLPTEEFAPNAHTTRAQAAVMIYRLLQQ
ncbi:S-layer homology domain-containing protein [Paenibacillus antri]|uniref:S-layer homology domain-containing protein n=1 Tax=Paenibacillus antri TaxID=2582848 RepID=A0A5R9GGY5_9BACL|nr:S-layer homology domain-containing protein [Paenibacillus antri]TLS52003.1 S-layer homology domain-containing protein [Paenibacillus antri]